MTRHASHAVNDGLVVDVSAALPEVEGFDVTVSTDNVARWGGDAHLYAHFVRAAVEVAGTASFLTVSALAAWRAGVVDLRGDALRRLAAREVSAVGAAAALGLPTADLDAFAAAQQSDPFAWPGRGVGDPVAQIGGFRGLGGPWQEPPVRGEQRGPGHFAVWTASEGWSVSCDVFGSRLDRLGAADPADPAGPAGQATGDAFAHVQVFATSYLALIVRGRAA